MLSSPGRMCLGQTPSATPVPRAGPRRVSEGAGGRPPTPPPGRAPQGCVLRNGAGATRERARGGGLGLPLTTVSPQGPHPAREEQGFG